MEGIYIRNRYVYSKKQKMQRKRKVLRLKMYKMIICMLYKCFVNQSFDYENFTIYIQIWNAKKKKFHSNEEENP